jgi:hypothetical protein
MRRGVPEFLAVRHKYLMLLGLPDDASPEYIRRAIKSERKRGDDKHWSFSLNRLIGLRTAYVALRYERMQKVREP